MRRNYGPQAHRPNRHKPSVVMSPFSTHWQARGYDANEHFHVATVETWAEALGIALQWAQEGYPEP